MLKDVKIQEVCAPVAAANDTDQNSDILDMQGWDGVMFIVPITDCVALGVAKLQVEQNTANSDTGMAALSGAYATVTSAENDDVNNKLLIVDVYKPRERYLQGVLTSTTQNIAFGNMIAIQYRGSKMPITQPASVSDSEFVVSPAEA